MRSLLVRVTLAGLAVWPTAAAGTDETLTLVRLPGTDRADAARLLAEGFDVIGPSDDGRGLALVASAAERARLRARGLAVEPLARGRPLRAPPGDGGDGAPDGAVPPGYPTLGEVYGQMLATADAFPQISRFENLTTSLGTPATEEGRSLFALCLSDDVGVAQDEPTALVLCCAHAREVITPVIALDTIARLTDGYGTDPRITALVDAWELWIVPVANPDGYVHVLEVDDLWRKNRRVFAEGIGVDLNRNFPTGWDAPCSGATSPALATYKGPAPASEAETQTIVALTGRERFARVLDFHSAGQEVLWGYACIAHPFDGWLEAEAAALSAASGYLGDERRPSAEGEHYEWQLARGAYAFLTETATTFQPTFAQAQAEAALVWPGTLYWLERPTSLSGHVTDAFSGAPLEAAIALPAETFVNGEAFSTGGPFGRYDLVLPPGTHELAVSAPGHVTRTESVVVTAASEVLIDVALEPLAVPGTWTDLGAAKAGALGEPELTGAGPLAPSTPQTLTLAGAAPEVGATLVFGLDVLLAPLAGGLLVPEPLLTLPLATDAGGGLALPFTLPAGTPAGASLFFQAWIDDEAAAGGLAASNAVWAVTS